MEWWQLAALMLLGTGLGGCLLVLRARLAQLTPGAAAAPQVSVAEAEAEHRCKHCKAVAALRMEWESYLEAFTDLDENVERKRRRIAARDSKESAKEAATQEGVDPRQALRNQARAMGLPV